MSFDFTRVIQVGVVVRNLDETMEYYKKNFGVGPFTIYDLDANDTLYYGKVVPQKCRIGMASLGPITIEFIEVQGGKTIHGDFYEKHGEGVDHIAFQVDDLAAAVAEFEAKGFKCIETQPVGEAGTGFAYIDADKVGGVMFELIQVPEGHKMV